MSETPGNARLGGCVAGRALTGCSRGHQTVVKTGGTSLALSANARNRHQHGGNRPEYPRKANFVALLSDVTCRGRRSAAKNEFIRGQSIRLEWGLNGYRESAAMGPAPLPDGTIECCKSITAYTRSVRNPHRRLSHRYRQRHGETCRSVNRSLVGVASPLPSQHIAQTHGRRLLQAATALPAGLSSTRTRAVARPGAPAETKAGNCQATTRALPRPQQRSPGLAHARQRHGLRLVHERRRVDRR